MKYLLDTCLISELVRKEPAGNVVAWVRAQQERHMFLSVLTIGELRKGIERMPEGRKRMKLVNWLDTDLKLRFSGRLLPIDEEIAERWGLLCAAANAKGASVPVLDGLIAATALVHGMTVVTRNVKDIHPTGALVCDPWQFRV